MSDLQLTGALIEAAEVGVALAELHMHRLVQIFLDAHGVERVRILPAGKRALRACAAAEARGPSPSAHPLITPSRGSGPVSRPAQP